MRFNAESMLQNFRDEYEAVKGQIPDARITTNFMPFCKPLDYRKWAEATDLISWDNYPEKNAEPALSRLLSYQAAVIFDWNTWWALESSAGPSARLKYPEECMNYYRAFYEQNIPVDVIGMEDDFSSYALIAAPLFYMVKPGVERKLEEYVKEGGTVIFTYMSGYVDENDYITCGGYPGKPSPSLQMLGSG